MPTIELPWPPSILMPNRKAHWCARGNAGAKYKRDCLMLIPKSGTKLPDGKIYLKITFHPPDRRRRDLDALLSAMKHGLDALAERLGVDDYRFRPSLDDGPVVKGGKVCVEVFSA